ncbi:MAG: metal ABC transporter ATP-binding protein [Patescibacteria group bacterium]|nr:metal ABC transporter ATP-binding protein [Patescibacteria group bacterium]MCX7589916.1 metal ABC transporter ATP-binding protein [Patescibacteria group bacterium]MDW8279596.1 metal ABC transporter ATP-binding protein [bacterium]
MIQKILEVKNLNVFLDNEKILDNISFTLNQGEILIILGPNGAGKSVLLKTILGILPYNGQVIWANKFKISYLPQGLNQLFFKNLPITVKDFFNLKNKKFKEDEIINVLKLVGLDKDILNKSIGNLSTGQFQRILIAWSLIDNPEVIFFDEPTTGIDIGGGETIYSLLYKIKQDKNLTIVLVTHDLNIVYGLADKVLCLGKKGHICFGPPAKALTPQALEAMFGMELKFYKH